MRRLIGIAVGIGLSLFCDVLYAGKPVVPNNALWPASLGYVRQRPPASTAARPAAPVYRDNASAAVHAAYARNHNPHQRWKHEAGFDTVVRGYPLVFARNVAGLGTLSSSSGCADLLNRREQYNLAASQAAINWQTAQAAAIQSQLDADKARDDARRAKAAAQRASLAERRLADHRRVKENNHSAVSPLAQLSLDQFDRRTGRIFWPEVLQGEVFNAARRRIGATCRRRPTGLPRCRQ